MYKVMFVLCLLFVSNYVNSQQTDPTRPFGAIASANSNEKSTTLVLQSIIESNNKRKAIINGQVLNVGDKYNGFNLITISKNGVVLDSPQGRMELSLFSGVIANSK
ncbi:MSHA biogenesis protein MshK [Colwellia sp. 6M3]|uniref:MSHA biogenesis protein MshK n=1 Tax=Colwellia sp. 6M3 TaxID=2759849 RepID=UPI000D3A8224|nr:MSHA biogenesis protein MshK [Colwellia sp. 6M3]AWB58993.1 MSHA biogenesis protein MshK [Colwellia sp. Arc7-D]MBA6414394.1 MSHA biogenesis protein MshK [Colwellia sp. 6M3]